MTVCNEDQAASNRLAAIVESSDDAIIGEDLNGIITSWNHGAEKIFGYTAVEMVGTTMQSLIPLDQRDQEEQILKKISHSQVADHFVTKRITKSGPMVDVSITISPIKNSECKIIGTSKVARDISFLISIIRTSCISMTSVCLMITPLLPWNIFRAVICVSACGKVSVSSRH